MALSIKMNYNYRAAAHGLKLLRAWVWGPGGFEAPTSKALGPFHSHAFRVVRETL